MGHRATYAIRQNGNVELFYSHWGALTVPEDIFWGPEETESFIRANEPCDEWLDDVWGEGGIGLDKDEKIISWFGGEQLGYPPYRDVLVQLMSALWGERGWTVRAVDNMPDIAEALGVDRAVATAEPLDPWPVDLEDLGSRWEEDQEYFAALVIRREDGVSQLVLDCGSSPFAAAGPQILDHLGRLPSLGSVLEHYHGRPLSDWESEAQRKAPLTNDVSGGVLVDTVERLMLVHDRWRASDHDLACFQRVWEGWTIRRAEGLEELFGAVGAQAPTELLQKQWWGGDEEERPEPTEDDILGTIAECLLGERNDPSQFMGQVLSSMEGEGHEQVWINPHAMVSPPDERPEAASAQAIFGRAVAALVRSRQS